MRITFCSEYVLFFPGIIPKQSNSHLHGIYILLDSVLPRHWFEAYRRACAQFCVNTVLFCRGDSSTHSDVGASGGPGAGAPRGYWGTAVVCSGT